MCPKEGSSNLRYNLAEQVTTFWETFTEEVALPTTANVVGTAIEVVGIDIAEDGEQLMARRHRGDAVQDLHLADLVFAPDTTAGRIHAAYRRALGLRPHPAAIPPGWKPSWL